MALTNALKNFILDVAGVLDFFLSLLDELYERYLSVRHIGQLSTPGENVRVPTSILCKIIARKDNFQ